MTPHGTLLVTVGASLLANLGALPGPGDYDGWVSRQEAAERGRLPRRDVVQRLRDLHARGDWAALARALTELRPPLRLLGAEIAAMDGLVRSGVLVPAPLLVLLTSDTADGRAVGQVLRAYFEHGGCHVLTDTIEGLQDEDVRRLRVVGLRNLVRTICARIRERGTTACGIDATGGYKAQIAIAVLLGQSLGVPVYYRHELFAEPLTFPPLPVGFDASFWEEHSDVFCALERPGELVPREHLFDGVPDPRLDAFLEVEAIDGVDHVCLSAAGAILHESLRARLDGVMARRLPAPAPRKHDVELGQHAWGGARPTVLREAERLLTEVPYVARVETTYWNPRLPKTPSFRLRGDEIQWVLSNGTWTAIFRVTTTAKLSIERSACVSNLNRWLHGDGPARDPAIAAPAEDRLACLESENVRLQRALLEAEERLAESDAARDRATNALAEARSEIASLTGELAGNVTRLEGELFAVQARIADLAQRGDAGALARRLIAPLLRLVGGGRR